MSDVRSCPEHGYFDAETCPVCRGDGGHALDDSRRETLSRFLSYVLRHEPGDAGLALSDDGWTDRSAVVDAVRDEYEWATGASVSAVVATDPKGRFEVDDDRIRASYGHSVDVDLDATDHPVPDTLYHATAPDAVPAILEEGVKPMDRQRVHLTDDREEALDVGRRHAADPVLLKVDAAGLLDTGRDVTKRGTHVYTTDRVSPEFVARA